MRVQFIQHLVRYGFVLKVLEEGAHCRVVRKAAVLLIEAEIPRVQMHHERRLAALVFAEDVGIVDHYSQSAKPQSEVTKPVPRGRRVSSDSCSGPSAPVRPMFRARCRCLCGRPVVVALLEEVTLGCRGREGGRF